MSDSFDPTIDAEEVDVSNETITAPTEPKTDEAEAVASAVPVKEQKEAKLSRKEAKAAKKASKQAPKAVIEDATPTVKTRAKKTATRTIPVKTAFDFTANRYKKVRKTRLTLLSSFLVLALVTGLLFFVGYKSIIEAQGIHNQAASIQQITKGLQEDIDRIASVNGVSGAAISADVENRGTALAAIDGEHVLDIKLLNVLQITAQGYGTLSKLVVQGAEASSAALSADFLGATNADAKNLRDSLRSLRGPDGPLFLDVELLTSGEFGQLRYSVTMTADLTQLGASQ